METIDAEARGFMELLRSQPEDLALSLLLRDDETDKDKKTKELLQNQLRRVCSELFLRIEALNGFYGRLVVGRKDEDEEEPLLSGLTDLYTGQDQDGEAVDAETLFGQIELLNKALTGKVRKSIKKISSSLEKGSVVRLLDEQDVSDSKQSGDGDSQQDDNHFGIKDGSGDEDEESEGGNGNDEERKRIEARMKRAMADMDDDDDDDDDDDSSDDDDGDAESQNDDNDSISNEGSMIDPAAEELNDGFFDINEMENFADEEEEYLPDEAFGEEKANEDNQDKRSFHQKQRDGDMDDNDEEGSGEEENDLLFRKENKIRRKRYRDEEEIDALYELYQDNEELDDGGEDAAGLDAVNLTAADLYGKPNKKYYEKWNSTKAKKTNRSDDDSWEEYDFEQSNEKRSGGWNHASMDDNDDDSRVGSAIGEEVGDDADDAEVDDDSTDEQTPMKSGRMNGEPRTKNVDKLAKQTEELEREILAEKPWQMRGETSGTARPVESLLDSTPEFEVATKQAPIITVEKTMSLEEIIKKRILNEDWDDVIPRELPDVAWNKNRGELPEVSQEKSKLGLGELYEREYMKKALGYDADATEKETEEGKAKNEMKSLFANLCSKLDALSNYHFAPRPIADEAEIRPVTKPAIAMEEVLPLHVSEARGVAPEEVYGGKRGRDAVLRGESELEPQDRKRMRSAKKAARRKARKEKIADEKLISKLQPGLGLSNPYEKRKMREELSVARAHGKITQGQADTNKYGGSGTFFKRMQQEVQQSIKGATSTEEDLESKTKRRNRSNAVKL